jgi:pre-mRNA-splicing factor ATP-dependent RNA helicase DHX38/PRP16
VRQSSLISFLLTTYYVPLAELGSVFYSVKEKNFDERGNRRQADREFSKRAELETEMARQREA